MPHNKKIKIRWGKVLLSRQPWTDVTTTHLSGTAGRRRGEAAGEPLSPPCQIHVGPGGSSSKGHHGHHCRGTETGSCGRPVFLALTCTFLFPSFQEYPTTSAEGGQGASPHNNLARIEAQLHFQTTTEQATCTNSKHI